MGMLKKVGIFLGIKYEPLSDPPFIKICEWGPWAQLKPPFGDSCLQVFADVLHMFYLETKRKFR